MKKIIRPEQEEKAEYFSDFSDTSFGDYEPAVKVKFEFGYGSKSDGGALEFDLTDEEAKYILKFMKVRALEEKRKEITKIVKNL